MAHDQKARLGRSKSPAPAGEVPCWDVWDPMTKFGTAPKHEGAPALLAYCNCGLPQLMLFLHCPFPASLSFWRLWASRLRLILTENHARAVPSASPKTQLRAATTLCTDGCGCSPSLSTHPDSPRLRAGRIRNCSQFQWATNRGGRLCFRSWLRQPA